MARFLSAKERIILPLDLDSQVEAGKLVRLMKEEVGIFKVGLELFIKEGPQVVQTVRGIAGNRIFVDLKLHDIPETVRKAAKALVASCGATKFVTVHLSAGEPMVQEAVEAIGPESQVLGVTVLTSQEGRDAVDRVMRLAEIARAAGCAGVVCSAREAKIVRELLGDDFIIVTPGIRPTWGAVRKDDQQRVMTPGEAITNGADFIVVGRPITQASDPVEAARSIAKEIEAALK